MEENLDFSTKKSIDEMLERAREEREKVLHLVDFFLETRVPNAFLNINLAIEHLNEINAKLGINFQISKEEFMKLKEMCIKSLKEIQEELENIKLTEEELLGTDVIEKSSKSLEEISNLLDIMPVKLLEKGKTIIFEGMKEKEEDKKLKAEEDAKLLEEKEKKEQEERKKQREKQELRQQKLKEQEDEKNKIKEEIMELEKQKMYLQGKLDASIFGKKDLREQISELESKIKEKREKLDTFSFNENDDAEQRETTVKKDDENKEIAVNDETKSENSDIEKPKASIDAKNQEGETIEF